jgi:hypothetical protein
MEEERKKENKQKKVKETIEAYTKTLSQHLPEKTA